MASNESAEVVLQDDVELPGAPGRLTNPTVGTQYEITDTARRLLTSFEWPDRIRLATWVYDQNLAGIEWPRIDSTLIEARMFERRVRVQERMTGLLRALRQRFPLVGQGGYPDDPIFYLASHSTEYAELRSLWLHAASDGYVELNKDLPDPEKATSDGSHRVWLTVKGYAWLESLDEVNAGAHQGFVAMWFDRSMDQIYADGFGRAIEEAGYHPIRVDQGEFAGKIDDEVIAQIRRSRFMVADLTAGLHEDQIIPRGSVYYEAGFAEGLGIPVLYTRRQDMKEAVHFDLRQHNFIVWTDADDLRQRLKRRISAVLGDGPHRQGD